MGFEFGRATTAAEIEAVQRLRYAVYVEEMRRYHDVTGGEDGRFQSLRIRTAGSSTRVTDGGGGGHAHDVRC